MKRKKPIWLPRVGGFYDVHPGGTVLILETYWVPDALDGFAGFGNWVVRVLHNGADVKWNVARSDVLMNWKAVSEVDIAASL